MNRLTAEMNNGYGFISVDGMSENVFFHKSELINCNIRQLEEGCAVEFDLVPGRNGKPAASNIRLLGQTSESLKIASVGKHPSVSLDHFNADERQIIDFLSTVFYITSGGGEINIGGSIYRYCLIKPTEYFNKTFHLSRELTVVFSDYVSFEPRSLDAASSVYQRITSVLRLDRGCHLLICHDNDVEEKLITILKDSKLVRNTLLSNLGKNQAKVAVVNAMKYHATITPRDVQKAEELSYQQLFDPSRNKMYFSLLKALIIDNMSAFSNIFESEDEKTIKDNLDAINVGRRCPDHAFTEESENWSWNDFVKFRKGITWLENIISDYE